MNVTTPAIEAAQALQILVHHEQDDLAGTIVRVYNRGGDLVLFYDDGRYAVFEAWTDDGESRVSFGRESLHPSTMLRAGLLTPADMAEYQAAVMADKEARERKEYQRLKAKFEPPVDEPSVSEV